MTNQPLPCTSKEQGTPAICNEKAKANTEEKDQAPQQGGEHNEPIKKKVRFLESSIVSQCTSTNKEKVMGKDEDICEAKAHPTGVRPIGNRYFDQGLSGFIPDVRGRGLGIMKHLPDELLLDLFHYLDGPVLAGLASVSPAFYVYNYHEEPWKQKVIKELNGNFVFKGSWRQTYLANTNKDIECSFDVNLFPAKAKNFYSDSLYLPWLCTISSLEPFLNNETIDRRSELSLEQFIEEYERPNKPVIITDIVTKWPAYTSWSEEKLIEKFGNVKFRAEAIDIELSRYLDYCHQTMDESPIYLFDKQFGTTCEGLDQDFEVPVYFNEDLFKLLGANRPDYRWLIIGPKRSGSTFHKDPNATSAWNAVITGAKKWIMFPPEFLPPGVYTNGDESEVTSPVSVMEWLLNYYRQAVNSEVKPLEAICRAGEIIYVPSGWWHLVINVEDSIALTQNYVSKQNAEKVMSFLHDKPDQVSGWKFCNGGPNGEPGQSLFEAFAEKYQEIDSELVERIKASLLKKDKTDVPSYWERITEQSHEGQSFSFGFQFDNEED